MDRYDVNDALTALAERAGAHLGQDTLDELTRHVAYVLGIDVIIATTGPIDPPATSAPEPDTASDATARQVRAATLLRAAALLRRLNGDDPSQLEGWDQYDVSDVNSAGSWDGTEYAAHILDGLALTVPVTPTVQGPKGMAPACQSCSDATTDRARSYCTTPQVHRGGSVEQQD